MKKVHDKYAPFWAFGLFLFWAIGISTLIFNLGKFWKGYVLDMVGPAWNYILFRGLYTKKAENFWTKFFTPDRTFFIFIFFTFSIEILQYFKVYNATFDRWDFVAYLSLLFPLYILDKIQTKAERNL